MADKKISDLTAQTEMKPGDLLEVSQDDGIGGFASKKVTATNLFKWGASSGDMVIENADEDNDTLLKINDGGTTRTGVQIHGTTGAVSLPRQPYVYVTMTNSQVAANATESVLNLDNVHYDILGEWDAVNHRYYATHAGVYSFVSRFALTPSITSTGALYVRRNGAALVTLWNDKLNSYGVYGGGGMMFMDAGQYLTVSVLQNGGSNRTVVVAFVWIAKVA